MFQIVINTVSWLNSSLLECLTAVQNSGRGMSVSRALVEDVVPYFPILEIIVYIYCLYPKLKTANVGPPLGPINN